MLQPEAGNPTLSDLSMHPGTGMQDHMDRDRINPAIQPRPPDPTPSRPDNLLKNIPPIRLPFPGIPINP